MVLKVAVGDGDCERVIEEAARRTRVAAQVRPRVAVVPANESYDPAHGPKLRRMVDLRPVPA